MTPNTSNMIRAIAATGRVTLTELKRQGVLVHRALCEMIDQGIKVRSTWSSTDQSCVYWIGAPVQLSQNHGRPITEMSKPESKAFADLIGTGIWYTMQQIADRIGVRKERASKYVQCIRAGRIGDGIVVNSRRINAHRYVFRFDLEVTA